MKRRILIITILSTILISAPALSGPASDALGTCMTDSLNGKERKQLGKWVFLAMSVHPEISKFSNVTEELQNESDKFIGSLITRLLTEDCSAEARIALNNESSVALTSAFEVVGKVAMQELMRDKNVNNAISGFEKYLDKEKLNALQFTN